MKYLCHPLVLIMLVILSGCSVGQNNITTRTSVHDEITPTNGISPATLVASPQIHKSPVVTSSLSVYPTAKSTSVGVKSFPDPQNFSWRQIITGFIRPVALTQPQGDLDRLFIVEQRGIIKILKNGSVLDTPFLDIRDRVNSKGNEQGLLGIAFHPQYQTNGEFFLNYTTGSQGKTIISRFRVSSDPNRADEKSEEILLSVDQPFPNHNGGGMAFGPDSYLYIGLGDGGSAGDPYGNGQSLETLLGKLLRIDVNGFRQYTIPKDNPFTQGGGKPEIWGYGLRNPWRFAFDSLTGELYIGDVGQDQWEEIDYLPGGSPGGGNFGWNYREGLHPYQENPSDHNNFIDPIWEYGHNQGCSITGGEVYRGGNLPEFQGIYIAADFCNGKIWCLLRDTSGLWQSQILFPTGLSISSFGHDNLGDMYFLDLSQGAVYKLERK